MKISQSTMTETNNMKTSSSAKSFSSKKYFISYASPDRKWAEWIAWQIEASGHSAIIQSWDFTAGKNFVLEMHEAASSTYATIAVLSADFVASVFAAPEWAAAFVGDPTAKSRKLIPARVAEVELTGLLSSVVYIDLHTAEDESVAIDRLIGGIQGLRRKPKHAPAFPKSPTFPKDDGQPKIRVGARTEKFGGELTQIELTIDADFDSFSTEDQDRVLSAVGELLKTKYDLVLKGKRRGSVVLTVELERKDALELIIRLKTEKLSALQITNVVTRDATANTLEAAINEYMKYEILKPRPGTSETGTVVYVDRAAGFGVLRRDLGGYMKFKLPKKPVEAGGGGSLSVGGSVQVEQSGGGVWKIR